MEMGWFHRSLHHSSCMAHFDGSLSNRESLLVIFNLHFLIAYSSSCRKSLYISSSQPWQSSSSVTSITRLQAKLAIATAIPVRCEVGSVIATTPKSESVPYVGFRQQNRHFSAFFVIISILVYTPFAIIIIHGSYGGYRILSCGQEPVFLFIGTVHMIFRSDSAKYYRLPAHIISCWKTVFETQQVTNSRR